MVVNDNGWMVEVIVVMWLVVVDSCDGNGGGGVDSSR